MYYFAAYIKGCEYEKKPTSAIKEEILKFIDLGLQSLSTQSSDVQEFWKKMFLQRRIYYYLRLSNKAYPISYFKKDSGDLEEANKLIAELSPMREGMDDRRKQLLLVADARSHEIEEKQNIQNIEIALEYLDEAISLDPQERFGETTHIKQYKSELQLYLLKQGPELKPCHEKQLTMFKRKQNDLKMAVNYRDLHPDSCEVRKYTRGPLIVYF